jgi:hypothetical protein
MNPIFFAGISSKHAGRCRHIRGAGPTQGKLSNLVARSMTGEPLTHDPYSGEAQALALTTTTKPRTTATRTSNRITVLVALAGSQPRHPEVGLFGVKLMENARCSHLVIEVVCSPLMGPTFRTCNHKASATSSPFLNVGAREPVIQVGLPCAEAVLHTTTTCRTERRAYA